MAQKTIISLEQHGKKHTSEINWDAGMNDILDALYGLCVAATFHPTQVLEGIRDWVDEKLEDNKIFNENS